MNSKVNRQFIFCFFLWRELYSCFEKVFCMRLVAIGSTVYFGNLYIGLVNEPLIAATSVYSDE